MVSKDRARRLKKLHEKQREKRELVDAFTGHLDYVLGRTDEDHPASAKFVNEGQFWRFGRGADPKDAPDLSE